MVDPLENVIGVEGYSSSTEGFGGKIKQKPEDFIVEEIPVDLPEKEKGKYTIVKIRLKDWDTNKFLIYLARDLRISKKRITYAGTKDKAGITTQYFCVNAGFDPSKISISDAEILSYFRTDKFLRLGDLKGNRFQIRIVYGEDKSELIEKIYSEITMNGGFPNFFGIQRFGALRTNTHKIGKLIVAGKYEEAVLKYIYDPEIDTEDYRKNFGETLDANRALKEFPEYLNFERTLLGYYQEKGKFEGAFDRFPKNLSMIFVHAYQSYIFNRILSERMKINRNLDAVLEGDIAYPVDSYFNMNKDEPIKVTKFNLEKISKLSHEDKVRPSIPLFGFESQFSKGIQGDIEKKVLENEGIEQSSFRVTGYPEISSKGERRIVSAKPLDFKIAEENTIEFSLGKGIYATSLIREFLK